MATPRDGPDLVKRRRDIPSRVAQAIVFERELSAEVCRLLASLARVIAAGEAPGSIGDLAREFRASESTMKRWLAALSDSGLVHRNHRGRAGLAFVVEWDALDEWAAARLPKDTSAAQSRSAVSGFPRGRGSRNDNNREGGTSSEVDARLRLFKAILSSRGVGRGRIDDVIREWAEDERVTVEMWEESALITAVAGKGFAYMQGVLRNKLELQDTPAEDCEHEDEGEAEGGSRVAGLYLVPLDEVEERAVGR